LSVLLSVLALVPAVHHHAVNVAVAEGRVPVDPRPAVVRPYRAKLERMAYCESTGRWFIATGNGFYGGLQFDLQTWRSVGGRGYPHLSSKLEQMYRAVRVIRRRGYSPWPICGYR
jgi:hypothetical protein